MKKIAIVLLLTGMLLGACQQKEDKAEITVSAAASLQDALQELKDEFEKKHEHITIHFNFGGSGTLQQQISQGAPVDLFISASEVHFQTLIQQQLIQQQHTSDWIKNDLVVIVPTQSNQTIHSLSDLTKVDRVAIGIPEVVPAGQYAKEVLTNENLWDLLSGELVLAKDVRQVLTYTETGNVDSGFVYHSDAVASEKVNIALEIDPGLHKPIIYPMGVVSTSKSKIEANEFFNFLQTEQAVKLLEQHGFKRIEQ